ncbi:MAG TPA: hypothetical protein VM674_00985 [Candidatus Acidoferrum sp.]|nr:hypothetical protein [Candidatus Acidoferrum sp.]
MKRLIGTVTAAAAATLGIGWLALASLPLAAQADTPGVSPTCFSQTANPHPTAPVSQTTDALFCGPTPSPTPGNGTSGSGSSGNGTSGSGNAGHGTNGSAQNAGYTTGANGSSSQGATAAGTTGGGGQGLTSGAGSKAGSAKPASSSRGFFGGLVAFLGTAGALGWFLWFLLLLAIVLFVIGVMAWLSRRDGGLGSRFSRIAHRP